MDGTALIGRSAELAEWGRALKALPTGGRVLSVGGEPGIGKSRLVAEFARSAADAGARVLRGHARERTSGTAYAPLVTALLPLTRPGGPDVDLAEAYRSALGLIVPDWRRPGADHDGDGDGLVVAEGVLRLLVGVAEGPGTVLVVEDLQWADPDTLAVLDHLARAADSVPVLLVTTTRADHPASVDMFLDRLDADQQDAMVTGLLGTVSEEVVRLVGERAEGLPLAVEEIVADLVRRGGSRAVDAELVRAATVPSIDAMVVERTRDLSPEALAAATAAALLDDAVGWRQVAPVAALDPDHAMAALAELAAVDILTADGRYRHGLIRDAVLRRVPPSVVRETAERAARGMRDTGDPADRAAAARLFERAEDAEAAAVHYLEASRRWLAIGAPRSAEVAARDALRTAEVAAGDAPRSAKSSVGDAEDVVGQGLRAEAGDALAESLTAMGRFGEALAVMRLITGLEGPRLAVLHCRAAQCALETRDQEAAAAHLDLAERIGGAAEEAATLRASLAYEAGDLATAARLAEEAVRLAETAAVPEALCAALLVAARVARAGDPADALAALERLYGLAVAEDLPAWRERALLDLGLVDGVTTGHTERLRRVGREAAERGALHTQAVAELNLWPLVLELGEIDEAQRICDHAAHLATRHDMRIRTIAVAMQTIIASMRGRYDLAAEIAERIGDDLPGQVNYRVFRALYSADAAGALATLDPVSGALNASLVARSAPARGVHALLRATEHLDAAPAERLRRDGVGNWLNRGLALLGEAVVAGRRGDRDVADDLSRRAYADLDTSPTMAGIATSFAIPYAIADGWGLPRDRLTAARARFELLGNDVMRRHCESLMQGAGIPVPRRGRGDAEVPAHLRALGVTSRETDVLLLVARGLTNAEIADRLSLSPRTVDSHVSRLLAKTNRTHRGQLPALLKEAPRDA